MLSGHDRAVLQFSGGKDSAALLYLARPYLDRITVLFGDTGAVFPHVVDFVQETCAKLGASLQIVKPTIPVDEYTKLAGLPSDIVPVEATQEMAPYLAEKPPQLLQSYARCCGAMLWQPMTEAIRKSGATLVLRGSKKSDARVGVPSGYIEGGIEYRSPLWNWSDEDVFSYLRQEGVELPDHYATVNDSLDCWLCTAHLAHHGAEKLRYIKNRYPHLWPEVKGRALAVQETLRSELNRLAPAAREIAS